MNTHPFPLRFATLLSLTLLAALPARLSAQDLPNKEDDDDVINLPAFSLSTRLNIGATPGGAQDINFFRMGAGRGQIPHPNTLTAEGLFSEHDLPLEAGGSGEALFRVETAATEARFEVLPEVRYLAQLGFSSSLQAETWQRDPLNLVAVVDKSGSMNGEPLALVRASLLSVLHQLRDGDQIGIVLYGDKAHVYLPPTKVGKKSRSDIARQIQAIESEGSTYLEAGLRLGYEVARASQAQFTGSTRVMLFTDERPNVGNTEATGFMGMAKTASRDGIGLTTIGVGVQFGAELATKISSVRGGNLFFFDNGETMKKTFTNDFDMMVTELAHEFSVRIEPAAGLRMAGVFGVPGEMLRWDDRAIVMEVPTIFLSHRKGAIYFALAPDGASAHLPVQQRSAGNRLATIAFNFRDARDGSAVAEQATCSLVSPTPAQVGLPRGVILVDEYLTLKKIAQLHHLENDQESAYQLAKGLLARLRSVRDTTLSRECELVGDIHCTLALQAGHMGEVQLGENDQGASPLVGIWRRINGSDLPDTEEFVIIWASGVIEPLVMQTNAQVFERCASITLDGPLPTGRRGNLPIDEDAADRISGVRYKLQGDQLRLVFAEKNAPDKEFLLERCDPADLPRVSAAKETIEIDELSGLPVEDNSVIE